MAQTLSPRAANITYLSISGIEKGTEIELVRCEDLKKSTIHTVSTLFPDEPHTQWLYPAEAHIPKDKAGNAKELLLMASMQLRVATRDWSSRYINRKTSSPQERYRSISTTGDRIHYVLEPLAEKLSLNPISGPDRYMTYLNKAHQSQRRINVASNIYSGSVARTEYAQSLHECAISSVLPQSDAAAYQPLIESLGQEIAGIHGDKFAEVTSSGYAANLVAMVAIATTQTIWMMDGSSHNSMFIAARASAAKAVTRFKANHFADLEAKLIELDCDNIIVAIEGLYSMEGTFPNMSRLAELKKKYGFQVLCDECHSIYTVGLEDRGIIEHTKQMNPHIPDDVIDIRTGGLGKSIGSIGGYVTTCSATYKEALDKRLARMTAEGLEPIPLNGVLQALYALRCHELLPPYIKRLQHMAHFVREKLTEAGLTVFGQDGSPIVPVHVGRLSVAFAICRSAAKRGLTILPVPPPAVPKARICMCLSADLTDWDINEIVRIVIHVSTVHKLLPPKENVPALYQYPRYTTKSDDEANIRQEAYDSISQELLETAALFPGPDVITSAVTTDIVMAAGLAGLDRYGFGSGSARWQNGSYHAHLDLEARLRVLFEGLHAVALNETRTAELSIAHALCRPLHGFSRHVLLSNSESSSAITEGFASAKRDKAISFRTYQSFAALLTIIDALAIEPRTTAITVFVERSTFDITQREAELFETFVRFTGRRSKKGRFTTIVVLNDTASINFQGQHGLGIASQLDIHTLSLQTGVRIVVFGSFYRALKLPGAFMVGDKHLMSELRVLCPSYTFSTSTPPVFCEMTKAALVPTTCD